MSISWNNLITEVSQGQERKSVYFSFPSIIIQDPAPIKGSLKGIVPPAHPLMVSQRAFKGFYDNLNSLGVSYSSLEEKTLVNQVKDRLGLSESEASKLINLAKTEASKEEEDKDDTGLISFFSYMDTLVNPPESNKNGMSQDTKQAIKDYIKNAGLVAKNRLRNSTTGGKEEVREYMMTSLESLMDKWVAEQEDVINFLNKLDK
jgi:hypothetical protein